MTGPRRPRRPSPVGALAALALWAAMPFAAGCVGEGGASEGRGTVELLARAPDGSTAQPGELVVAAGTGFGRRARFGWDRVTADRGDGGPCLWTTAPLAGLELPFLGQVDREVSLEVVDRVPGEPVRVQVHLHGQPLGEAVVDATPVVLSFPAPRHLWTGERALLEVGVGRTAFTRRPQREGGDAELGVAVARVSYGERREVRWDAGARSLELAPGTSVHFGLERDVRAGARLLGRAVSDRNGRLDVALVPRVGQRLDHAAAGPTHSVELEGGVATDVDLDLGRDLQAPSLQGRDLALVLRWNGDAAVTLARLDLQRALARPLPPIVFVSIDTVAARSLGLHGYARDTSPRLEEFARECVVFERCLANSTWTAPSYLSQFTGLLPEANRVIEADGEAPVGLWDERVVARERWTLAEALRARGYRTGGFVANTWLALTRGIRRGFDHFDQECSQYPVADPRSGADEVFARALAWLERPGGRPPFAFVQVLDPHAPYLPGAGWRGRFGGDRPGAEPLLPVVPGTAIVARALRRSQTAALGPEGERVERVSGARMRALYDENLAELDASLGRFLDRLREQPWFDEAVVVVTADHGEAQDDARFVFDHYFPEPDVLHVPLVVRLPRGARGGTRVSTPVELVDLYPTLVEAAGLDASGRGLDGRSLWPLLEGEHGFEARPTLVLDGGLGTRAVVAERFTLVELPLEELPPATLLSIESAYARWAGRRPDLARRARAEGVHPDGLARLWGAHGDPLLELAVAPELVQDLVDFYASGPGVVHELHDRVADPSGRDDVAAEHPEVVAELAALLAREREARAALRPSLAEADDDGGPADAAAVERLRALGYLGGG